MPSIVELSTEPKYTIKAVASQTGIQPVTLRAWERRHEILTPHRGNNRYRLYSERDVAILRWIKFRVAEGMSIRTVVGELRAMASSSLWPDALPVAPAPTHEPPRQSPEDLARGIFHALSWRNEDQAGELLREAHASYDLNIVCAEILSPAIAQIEQAHYLGRLEFATQRFAHSYLRGRLISLLQSYPTRNHAPLALLGCAPMEMNELHTIMLAVLLRKQGWRTEYLGPDLSMEDLADYAADVQPDLVILSATSEFTAREMRRAQEIIRQTGAHASLCTYGAAFEQHPRLRQEIQGSYLGGNFEEATRRIQSTLGVSLMS
jgi:MerR family transcriptional regulator, light-induced transcriptional regulator